MLSPVSAVEAAGAGAGSADAARRQEVPTLADKMRAAGMALERTKRDLAAAQLRAQRQERALADARRELEQLRWLNASAETNPETARHAAALESQNAAIDAALKAEADASAQIVRLQSRIERQTTRFFDLQNRVREGDSLDKARTGRATEPGREGAEKDPPPLESRQEPPKAAREPREAARRDEKWDIRDFAALARRASARRASNGRSTAPT